MKKQFKIKDLIITIPKDDLKPINPLDKVKRLCPVHTLIPRPIPCFIQTLNRPIACPNATFILPIPDTTPVQYYQNQVLEDGDFTDYIDQLDIESLSALKEQLELAIKEIEKRETEFIPNTQEELDLIEQKLKDGLKGLQELKKNR